MVLKRAEAMVLKPEAEVIEKPPAGASLLLACVAPAGRSECVLGSAQEEYRKVIVLLSPRRARWWYRVYVVKAASRMLPSALMRVLLLHKLIGLLGL
jgi:hypothetical protein